MRVCFLTPFGLRRRGTVSHRVFPLAALLALHGAQVRLLVAGWDQPEEQGKREHTENVEVFMLPFNPAWLNAGSRGVMRVWWSMAHRALMEVRSWQPDVVVLSKPVAVPLMFLLLARGTWAGKRWCPSTVILDCDDLEHAWTTGVPLARLWRRLGRQLEPLAWRLADRVTVASHFLLQKVREARQDEEVVWLPNMAPRVKEASTDSSSYRIVVPTRLLDIAPADLVPWLAAIVEQEPRANVLVVGPDRAAADALKRALDAAGLQARVAIVLHQPREAYYHLLRSARVGVYIVEDTPATRAKCPRRLLDLMALGVPTVAVDVGEAHWLIEDTGFVVTPRPDVVADATRIMWRNAQARAYLSQRAKARAAREFGPEATWERFTQAVR